MMEHKRRTDEEWILIFTPWAHVGKGMEEEQGHELALAGRAENDTFLVLRGWCREHAGSLVLQVA